VSERPTAAAALVGVMGAGAWGTALAIAAARAGHPRVILWARDPDHAAELAATRRNERRLPGAPLPGAVEVTADPAALRAADPLLLAVPAQAVREACAGLRGHAGRVVVCAKGLERATGLRLSEVVRAELPAAVPLALSGPSFAREVAQGLPTALTVGADDLAAAADVAALLASPALRLYPSDDLLGVELGGALKNVVAIAAGAVIGMGLGENAKAALVTRGLAEMARLAEALGARRETLTGLSGLGDLVLTAASLTSRNTRLGHELGRGRSPAELLAPGEALSEGARTAEAACRLARSAGVELPIADAVRRVVAGEVTAAEAVGLLLARPPAARE
jgi:glycerol-3-phosphate dehydrogenase (NAD(P)+)